LHNDLKFAKRRMGDSAREAERERQRKIANTGRWSEVVLLHKVVKAFQQS